MSLSTQGRVTVHAINTASLANTAAATSGWLDCRSYVGDIQVIMETGAVTGSVTWSFQRANESDGTGAEALAAVQSSLAAVTTANQTRSATVRAEHVNGWLQVVGTIVTGPVLGGVTISAHPKYTT